MPDPGLLPGIACRQIKGGIKGVGLREVVLVQLRTSIPCLEIPA